MDEQFDTEISSWAYINHTDDDRPPGGLYTAYTRDGDIMVGTLGYYFITKDHTQIQFKEVTVKEAYRRRRVATALLRHLNFCHPEGRINPGIRNPEGNSFMDHILKTEAAKVATNGILSVPLNCQQPSGFNPGARPFSHYQTDYQDAT